MTARRAQFVIWFALLSLTACGEPPTAEVDEASFAASRSAGGGTSSNNLTSTAVSKSQIDLSWLDEATNETGWQIHRSTSGPAGTFTLLATTGANVTGYSDTGLTPLTQYCYRVRSFRTTGKKTSYSAFSNVACATTQAPPPPTGTNAVPSSSSVALVTWADQPNNAASFRIERSIDAGATWSTAASVDSSHRSYLGLYYLDQGRTAELPICYRVFAVIGTAESAASNIDCTTLPAAPGPLVVTEPYPQGVALNWNDNSAVEEGYRVWTRFFAPFEGYYVIFSVDLPAGATHYEDYLAADTCNREYQIWALKDGGTSDALSAWAGPNCGSSGPGAVRAESANGGSTRPTRQRP